MSTLPGPVRREVIPGARGWSVILRRGYQLQLIDREGGANCSALFFNAAHLLERYNMADTLKAQYTAFLTRGHVCYSDMGRILVSITDDSVGWHDTFCGVSRPDEVMARYGSLSYQTARNGFHRSGYELFLVELGKWGLSKRDVIANVNFFSKVIADADGALAFVTAHSPARGAVTLRAEMDTLVVLNTAPHALDPAPIWSPRSVDCVISRAAPVADDDPCVLSRAENARGFANTAVYHCQCGTEG